MFDNMGGGRSQLLSFGGRQSGFGGSSGLTRTNMAGFNYSDKFFKDLDINVSYYVNDTQNKNDNRSRAVNLLPDGDFITESESSRVNNNINHNANVTFEYKLNPTTKLFVNPIFTRTKNDLTNKGFSKSMLEDGTLLNESEEESLSTTDSYTFKNTIQFNKKLNDNGQNFSLRFENDNSKNEGLGQTNSTTLFYQDNEPADIRNQEEISRRTDDVYTLNAEFSQPINEKTYIDFGYTLDYNNQIDNLNTYNFSDSTNGYTEFNDRLSNQTHVNIVTNTPYVGINYQTDKIFWFLNSGMNIADYQASAFYMNTDYHTSRKFVSPYVQTSIRYRYGCRIIFSISYDYNVSSPRGMQILSYARLHSPLHRFIEDEILHQA